MMMLIGVAAADLMLMWWLAHTLAIFDAGEETCT